MTDNALTSIVKQLKDARAIAVFCHVRPDGDALGSGLALVTALKSAGKTACMLCEEAAPDRLKILPAMDDVCTVLPQGVTFDLLVSVDCADLTRLGTFASFFKKFRGTTINIDHHISNDRFASINYVCECTATCEIIPDVLRAAGLPLTKDIADLLALGLLTDSGNFSHQDVTQNTFAIAAELRAAGADFPAISYAMFSRQTKNRALLYVRVLNSMRFCLDDRLVFLTVTQNDFRETDTDKSQTEGFVDFPLSIDGVEVSIALMEVKQGQYKASLRSKRISVNAVASEFGGGGHILARGCMLFGEYEEVIERLTYAVYKQL